MIAYAEESTIRLCPICSRVNMLAGRKIEDIRRSCHVEREDMEICFGCQLDSWLPSDYEHRESYRALPNLPPVATKRPSTGVYILDFGHPPRPKPKHKID